MTAEIILPLVADFCAANPDKRPVNAIDDFIKKSKKIEAKEVKMAILAVVVLPLMILGFMAMGIALFTPETPHWVMIVYLLAYGVVRSIQFTNVNALGFADLTPQNLSRGNSISSVTQQLSSTFGIALAATVLGHRVVLNFQAEAEGITVRDLVTL